MPNNPNAADNLTPFEPGKSGNPNGRPSGPISQLLREYGDAYDLSVVITKTKDGEITAQTLQLSTDKQATINQVIAVQLLHMALKGDIRAIREVIDRTEGKAKQSIELGGSDGEPIRVSLNLNPNKAQS